MVDIAMDEYFPQKSNFFSSLVVADYILSYAPMAMHAFKNVWKVFFVKKVYWQQPEEATMSYDHRVTLHPPTIFFAIATIYSL